MVAEAVKKPRKTPPKSMSVHKLNNIFWTIKRSRNNI
jgi:hypothetical protein